MLKIWKTLSKNLEYGSPFFELFVEKVETFGGKVMDSYYRMELGDWVQVIAVDESDQMIMIKQYRHGNKKTHLEIVGGAVDKGEDVLLAAKRELLEETGYESSDWTKIAESSPNPAIQNNVMHTYLAKSAKKVAEQNLDPYEEIDLVLFSHDEVKKMLVKNEIDHSLVMMSLLKYYSLR